MGALPDRRFSRNLALGARELVPAIILIRWLAATMAGHGQAVMILASDVKAGWLVDAEPCDGWVISWPERGEIQATMAEKQWAWTQLRQAGYGMPAQHHVIEQDLRLHASEASGAIDYNALQPGQIRAIREALRKPTPELPEIIDVPEVNNEE